jgi:hypothetical protein
MSKLRPIKISLMLATLVLWSLPSLAAELTYNTDYYRPPAAGATRIPRSSNAGAFVTLNSFPVGGITGTPHQVTLSANPSMMINSLSYALVSATISGGTEGVAQAYPDSTGRLPTYVPVWVGNNPIVVTYVYLPSGGNGPPCTTPPCSSAAVIDEASDVTGGLLDDVFVQEIFQPQTNPDPVPAMTTHDANYLGLVDTTNGSVKIVAFSDPQNPANLQPTGSKFDRWVSPVSGLNPGPGVLNLDLNGGQSGYFLAYYRHSCPVNFHFVASPTLSACEPDDCKTNQFWDASLNQCEMATCFVGETCGHYTCPRTCPSGCIVVPPETAFNKTSKPIFACHNANGRIGTPLPE